MGQIPHHLKKNVNFSLKTLFMHSFYLFLTKCVKIGYKQWNTHHLTVFKQISKHLQKSKILNKNALFASIFLLQNRICSKLVKNVEIINMTLMGQVPHHLKKNVNLSTKSAVNARFLLFPHKMCENTCKIG